MKVRQIKIKKVAGGLEIKKTRWKPTMGMDRLIIIDDAPKTSKMWREMSGREMAEKILNFVNKHRKKVGGKIVKTIEIKKGNRTIYKNVPDDYDENNPEKPDYPTGDLTTGTIKSLNMGMTKEQYNQIFGKDKNAR